jgi:hypothetical protein
MSRRHLLFELHSGNSQFTSKFEKIYPTKQILHRIFASYRLDLTNIISGELNNRQYYSRYPQLIQQAGETEAVLIHGHN